MDANVVRTVFKTEWLGSSVLSNMIRQYGAADKMMKGLGGVGGGGNALAASNVAKARTALLIANQRQLATAVADGGKSFTLATMEAGAYSDKLGAVAAGQGTAAASAGVMGTGLSALVVGLAAAAAAVVAVVVAFKALYPVLEEGATVAQLDQSFSYLNATMSETPNLLRDMKEASHGTLTTMAAQEGFMTLVAGSSKEMTQALADAAPRILEISKAANKLNPALGDTNFMFTSLAKGLKRAEPRLIDNLGLKLRVSDANRAYAKTLGKTVAQLTAEEKQMAILNETLRAGALLIEQVGGSVEGLGDIFLQVDVAGTDFKNSLKSMLFYFLDLSGAAEAYIETLEGIGRLQSNISRISQLEIEGGLSEEEASEARWRALGLAAGTLSYTKEVKFQETLIKLGEERLKIERDIAKVEAESRQEEIDDLNRLYGEYRDSWDTTPTPVIIKEAIERTDLSEYNRMRGGTAYRKATAAADRAEKRLEEFTEAEAEALKDNQALRAKEIPALQAWADGITAASKQAIESWHEYNEALGDLGEKHAEADAETSLYTVGIAQIGETYRNLGGPTKEQTELLGDLEDALEGAREGVSDLDSGLTGFGMDEEKLGKAVEKAGEKVAWFEQKIKDVKVAEDNWVAGQQDAVWSSENLASALKDEILGFCRGPGRGSSRGGSRSRGC